MEDDDGEAPSVKFHTGQMAHIDLSNGDDKGWGPGLSFVKEEAIPKLNIGDEYADIRRFLMAPVVGGAVLKTVITRQKTGFLGRLPSFELRLDPAMGLSDRAMIFAKKQSGNKTSNYHISMDRHALEATSKYYLGKVRANLLGTEYVIYDDGVSQHDASSSTRGDRAIRLEHGAVLFKANAASATPREMTVVLPVVAAAESKGVEGVFGIIERHRRCHDGTFLLQQKTPRWNERSQTYSLDFHGRVKIPSVKNFILSYIGQNGVDDMMAQSELEREVLLFGKLNNQEQFIMDVRWPLSPIQAFAIAIASFDPKFACE